MWVRIRHRDGKRGRRVYFTVLESLRQGKQVRQQTVAHWSSPADPAERSYCPSLAMALEGARQSHARFPPERSLATASRYREALSASDGEVIVLRLGSNMRRLSRKALEQRAAYFEAVARRTQANLAGLERAYAELGDWTWEPSAADTCR